MPKTYLRYEKGGTYGVVVSQSANVVCDKKGDVAVCAALQDVIVWNLKTEVQIHKMTLGGSVAQVSRLDMNDAGDRVSAGYEDGRVAVWNMMTGKKIFEGKGHRKAVTAIKYSKGGKGGSTMVATGGADTDIVLWDTVRQAGEFRLRGHNDAVTDLCFADGLKFLISSSKDTLMKLWNLDTQHCVQTCVGHRSEVWSIAMDPTESWILSGSSDRLLRVWQWEDDEDAQATTSDKNGDETKKLPSVVTRRLRLVGDLKRSAGGRATCVRFNAAGTHVACQGAGKGTDLWRLRTNEQAQKKRKRRVRRRKEKMRKNDKIVVEATSEDGNDEEDDKKPADARDELLPSDAFETVVVVRTKTRAQSFAFAQGPWAASTMTKSSKQKHFVGLVFALQNNSLGLFRVRDRLPSAAVAGTLALDKLYSKRRTLGLQGHRSGVRALTLSHDNSLLVSVSSEAAKVWRTGAASATGDRGAFSCIRTIDTGYGLCAAFVSGDRHVVIGTKSGTLQLLSLSSAEVLETIEDAHDGPVWSLAMRPDRTGFVTGSGDNSVKFWEFDVVESASGGQRLTAVHTRTLKMSDEVLFVKYSHAPGRPEKLLLAVALLDSTVKLFYDDTLKFHLSLYGHKLPVMSLDISSDDALLVTASSDKDVKLWGLDFGDCHKSLFAHSDAVTSVAFVRGTHYFFSCGKDGLVKYWDGDTYDLILELRGHTREAWGCVVSNDGEFIVSCSHDRSLRMWERTQDQVFLDEERENRMESLFFEEAIDRHANSKRSADGEAAAFAANEGGAVVESQVAGKKSLETVKTAERLIDAIELVLHERNRLRESSGETTKSNPLLLGLSPLKYIQRTLRRIRASEMEQALLVLPFHLVEKLLGLLAELAKEGNAPELVARCAIFLLRLHHGPVTASRTLHPVLVQLRDSVRLSLTTQRNRIGFNIAGMRMLKSACTSEDADDFFVAGDIEGPRPTKRLRA